MRKLYVLRWGHRARDFRVTTHICLTARALGADGLFLTDVTDVNIEKTVSDVAARWGGRFDFQMGRPWKSVIKDWKEKGGFIIHLTMYGENVSNSILSQIRELDADVLVLVGSQKVPASFYSEKVSDCNIAIGDQPHSEVAALAIFLDRLFHGAELTLEFKDAKMRVLPSRRGKALLTS